MGVLRREFIHLTFAKEAVSLKNINGPELLVYWCVWMCTHKLQEEASTKYKKLKQARDWQGVHGEK